MPIRDNQEVGSVSLAGFVLGAVDRVQAMTGEGGSDPALANLSVKEITFSIPYDPGADVVPRPTRRRVTLRPLSRREARSFLLGVSGRVKLDRATLTRVPTERIERLELKIRLR